MSFSKVPARRRRRAEFEQDSDEDVEVNDRRTDSSDSMSSRRARRNVDDSSSPSASPGTVLPNGYRSHQRGRHDSRSEINGEQSNDEEAAGKHQPGAIVRVKVVNFVTYEQAVFYPGPNLNMVIGPNGTGKSSLVCAICLGLGYGPIHLGRAGKIGEFVKHGKDDAIIEIELQSRPEDAENPVVRVRITRDGDKRKWWINGNEASLKNVQKLTREFGIQVDNLCQFLPQDRVAEFAGLNPVELLHHTQRAAAPEEMLVWHDSLKMFRKEQKDLQLQHETDQEALQNSQMRQQGLSADVARFRERDGVEMKIKLLNNTKPFVEYKEARQDWHNSKAKKREATNRLKELEEQVGPSLQEVNGKEVYHDSIAAVLKDRNADRREAERVADHALTKIEEASERIIRAQQKLKAEHESDRKRKQEYLKIQQKIKSLESQLENTPPDFKSDDWNRRIREKEHRIRDIETEERQLANDERELKQHAGPKRTQILEAKTQLASLDSQAGKQTNKLKKMSQDTAQAWDWIQENRDRFEHQVYGPPIVECSVKDLRYVNQIESMFRKSNFLAITVQSRTDYSTLSKALYDELKLADIQICTTSQPLETARRNNMPRVPEQDLREFGLDTWALDLIDGPEPVLSMLCATIRIHSTGISRQDTMTDAQFAKLVDSGIQTFITPNHNFQTTGRREYGPNAKSTMTRSVVKAQNWTDQPVDGAEKKELQQNIEQWNEEFQTMSDQIKPMREKRDILGEEKKSLQAETAKLREDKNMLQTAVAQYNALPAKLQREQENLEQRVQQGTDFRRRVQSLTTEHDDLHFQQLSLALEHKTHVTALRTCHNNCLEAEMRLIEAASDIEALKQRNIGITQQLAEQKRLKLEAEDNVARAKVAAASALEVCKSILNDDEENREYYNGISGAELSMTELENDIDAEKAKLDFMHGGNPGAVKEFETRQLGIERLEEKIAETSQKLEKLSLKISGLREKWEPELDKLIAEISDAFAYNFEQISCAGEVGVHKDDDFDLWSIEIKVKFRENETLQLLDQHRQSGGERAVSTIFYLMALQSLARAPFRVVDEINQGMDPRNERMVHERMVEIACREHTSQYFLITPKLLTNLRYHPRMKVLCIASGEYMPEDHKQLDVTRVLQLRRALMT